MKLLVEEVIPTEQDLFMALDQESPEHRIGLLVEERNLLSVAYKNVIGARRAGWRICENKDGNSPLPPNLEHQYTKKIEAELTEVCTEVLELLQSRLLPLTLARWEKVAPTNIGTDLTEEAAEASESRVFFLKMCADYYRYMAEFRPNAEYGQNAASTYQSALDLATMSLKPTHPIRLGLALNCSVCQFEILNKPVEAQELAKKAFDDAISQLDQLEERSYKDCTLIMQLLRDNLTLWQNSTDDASENNNVEVTDVE